MKRKNLTGRKTVIAISIATLCLTGCGTGEPMHNEDKGNTENVAGVEMNDSNKPEKETNRIDRNTEEKENITAEIFEGLHYAIAVPTDWEMNGRECWMSKDNNAAQFWVTDYDGANIDEVCENLTSNGAYTKSGDETYVLTYEDENERVYHVKLVAEKGETIGIFYCYPKDAMEADYEEILGAIADTLTCISRD